MDRRHLMIVMRACGVRRWFVDVHLVSRALMMISIRTMMKRISVD